jgi:hypothetical protein
MASKPASAEEQCPYVWLEGALMCRCTCGYWIHPKGVGLYQHLQEHYDAGEWVRFYRLE